MNCWLYTTDTRLHMRRKKAAIPHSFCIPPGPQAARANLWCFQTDTQVGSPATGLPAKLLPGNKPLTRGPNAQATLGCLPSGQETRGQSRGKQNPLGDRGFGSPPLSHSNEAADPLDRATGCQALGTATCSVNALSCHNHPVRQGLVSPSFYSEGD